MELNLVKSIKTPNHAVPNCPIIYSTTEYMAEETSSVKFSVIKMEEIEKYFANCFQVKIFLPPFYAIW